MTAPDSSRTVVNVAGSIVVWERAARQSNEFPANAASARTVRKTMREYGTDASLVESGGEGKRRAEDVMGPRTSLFSCSPRVVALFRVKTRRRLGQAYAQAREDSLQANG